MENTKQYTIRDIEAISEWLAKALAEETLTIKEHTVYLVDFGGYFGYSCLVFKNGHHIHYANDYALHHKYTKYNDDGTTEAVEIGREELRQRYIDALNFKLWTEEEITGPLKDYDEYQAKSRFLHNYYGMREDYVSIFGDFRTDEKVQAYRKRTAGMIMNPVAMAYFAPEKSAFVEHHKALWEALEQRAAELEQDYDYLKTAFLREMYDHEYGINWQGDWDVLSCFGDIEYRDEDGLTGYFDQLEFNDTQRRAYMDARRQYYNETRDWN